LAAWGCDIVRLAVPDAEAAAALPAILQKTTVPLVADIHFDHRLALTAIEAGIHGLRINPGNIGSRLKLEQVIKAAAQAKVPIRVGANSGSLPKDLRHLPMPEALVESAMRQVHICEELGFDQIKISVKASELSDMVSAYRQISKLVDYPLHLGLTEAGTMLNGAVRSAAALAILMAEGIGDTIRISLACDPLREVEAAHTLLQSLGLRAGGLHLIACPTCARCQGDVVAAAEMIEKELGPCLDSHLRLAVMGCEVNGPGEAAGADIGLAFMRGGQAVLFEAGQIVKRGPAEDMRFLLLEMARTKIAHQKNSEI